MKGVFPDEILNNSLPYLSGRARKENVIGGWEVEQFAEAFDNVFINGLGAFASVGK
jgi:hypothetical protein